MHERCRGRGHPVDGPAERGERHTARAPRRRDRDPVSSVWMPAVGQRPVVEVGAGGVRLAPEHPPAHGRASVPANGTGRRCRRNSPRTVHRATTSAAATRHCWRRRRPVGETVDGVRQLAVGAEREGGDGDGGGAARGVVQLQRRPDLVRLVRAPTPARPRTTLAARLHGQVMYAVTPCGAGWVRKRSSVTTPKLPLPAPRSAQKRSVFVVRVAVSCLPSAVTSVAPVRLSQVSP